MIRTHHQFFTRTIPFAIARAAGDLLHAFERQPMEARQAPTYRKPATPKAPPRKKPLHTYRVLEARARRARRRANRR